jgi:hypothetical protein
MSHSQGTPDAPTLVVRLSVPADGDFRAVVADLAVKVAEFLGNNHDPTSAGEMIEGLAAEVVPRHGEPSDITFEFHQANGELRIEARCAGRSSEARRPLPT